MKNIIAAIALLTLASCGSTSSTEDTTTAKTAITDPVCKMPKNDDWTEYSLNGSDTVWFCSPHCKETYDKDPAKYTAK